MKIKIEREDIECGNRAIENAVLRQHRLDCVVDTRFLAVKGNERNPRRLPLSAELFQIAVAQGKVVKEFEFEL